MPKKLDAIFIFIIFLVIYTAFNASLPITDPVESNYALTAKEMMLSGDMMSPRIYNQYWYDKPAMIYWLIILCFKLFGINEFATRVPAAIFSAASVALIYWFTLRLFAKRNVALLSALVLGTSFEFWVLGHMVITDAVLFFFNSLAMVCFYLGTRSKIIIWYVIAYMACGLAVLTKGPIGLLLPGLIMVLYVFVAKKWYLVRQIRLYSSSLAFLLVAVPWYGYMSVYHGKDFVDTFLGLHNFFRATISEHPQDNVFYYYLVLFPVSLLPWTGVFFLSFTKLKKLNNAHFTFLMLWMGTIVLFYTLMATKYPTYVFPAMFPATILIAQMLAYMQEKSARREWLCLSIPTMLFFAALAYGANYIPYMESKALLYGSVAIAISLIMYIQGQGNVKFLPQVISLTVIVVSLSVISQVFSSLTDLRSSKEIVKLLPASGAEVAIYGDYSTSAVFYSGYIMPKITDKPKTEDTWSGKYTMPVESISAFDDRTKKNSQTYILLDRRNNDSYSAEKQYRDFSLVASYKEMLLYRRTTY